MSRQNRKNFIDGFRNRSKNNPARSPATSSPEVVSHVEHTSWAAPDPSTRVSRIFTKEEIKTLPIDFLCEQFGIDPSLHPRKRIEGKTYLTPIDHHRVVQPERSSFRRRALATIMAIGAVVASVVALDKSESSSADRQIPATDTVAPTTTTLEEFVPIETTVPLSPTSTDESAEVSAPSASLDTENSIPESAYEHDSFAAVTIGNSVLNAPMAQNNIAFTEVAQTPSINLGEVMPFTLLQNLGVEPSQIGHEIEVHADFVNYICGTDYELTPEGLISVNGKVVNPTENALFNTFYVRSEGGQTPVDASLCN